MSNEIGSETTTHVPLLKYDEEEESLVGLSGSRDEAIDNDSLEGHIITVVKPTRNNSLTSLVRKPVFWLLVIISLLLLTCIILGALLSASKKDEVETKKELKSAQDVCLTEGCLDAAHYMFHAMNHSADPCNDFFDYSCGGWIKRNPIPDSKPFWGTFSYVWDQNLHAMKQLLTNKNLDQSKSTAIQLAKTFYKSCLNLDRLDQLKASPLQKILKKLGGWSVSGNLSKASFSLLDTLKKVQLEFQTTAFFNFYISADDKNSSRNIIKIDQGGLGIEKSYYLVNHTDENLKAYHDYMTTVGVLLGGEKNQVQDQMMAVLNFEKELAKIFTPPENRSQIDQLYRKMNIGALSKISPEIKWLDFFQAAFNGIASIKNTEDVVVYATEYLTKLPSVIKKANSTVLNNYMIWQVVKDKVSMLSMEFRQASHKLDKVLEGTTTVEERWKTCISLTDGTVGMALANLFVKEKFQGSSKKQATAMIDAIRNAFKFRLPKLDWMDDKTRVAAIGKVDAIVDMIGFPDYVMDITKLDEKYKNLKFTVDEFFQNTLNSDTFSTHKNLKNLRKPVEESKWFMTPQTVNAYYSPSRNQIVFPAGILQVPYYDKNFPKYCNYGSIGGAVGHELVHAFDNSGSQYDKKGNYGTPWWTKKSIKGFAEKADCLIKQYSRFSYFGRHVNGKFTLGENIADNGGLKAAHQAYQNWVTKNGQEKTLPLLKKTNDQLFFIAYGQSWCANIREEKAKVMLDFDPHSPNKFRVLGTLANLKEFSHAFNCPVGSKMNPSNKCVIW